MNETDLSKIQPSATANDEEEWKNLSQNLIPTLPENTAWSGLPIRLYDGIWYPEACVKGFLYLNKYFKPHETDIILSSLPKSGSHWLKALSFSIVNRSQYSLKNTPLLTCSIDQLIPSIEIDLVKDYHFPNLDIFTQPRIFATHESYASLPCSVKDSGNKIVYMCRNPLDHFISLWIFLGKIQCVTIKMDMLDESLESFCQGNHVFGPFWDHILGYWQASIERPDKVLFLKYEDLKKDHVMQIKKLATFLGFPFTEDEENQGLIQEILKFCSFESMKNLEVNKTGHSPAGLANNVFFREGKVGDFHKYLSPDKIVKLKKLSQEKFDKFGLSF